MTAPFNRLRYVLSGALIAAGVVAPDTTSAQARGQREGTVPTTTLIRIPESIRVEHEAIHEALVRATKAPGSVGAAARELAAVLHPHFVREEQIALPPLGLLAPLARGEFTPEMRGAACTFLAGVMAVSRPVGGSLTQHIVAY